MIAYIKGVLSDIDNDSIVVENNGTGYLISVPLTVIEQMPSAGSDIKVYTYLYVREDAMSLYGFLTKDDLQIFKLLITVNGIGPRGALGILSTITPDDLRFAVLSNDTKTISKAPGIGNKTAQKLIIELKDKLSLEDALEAKLAGDSPVSANDSNTGEAIMALVALGYSNADAMKAVKMCEVTAEMGSDDILKAALKKIMLF